MTASRNVLERKAVVFAHVNRLGRRVRRVVTAVLKNAKTKKTATENWPERKSTSQPEAEVLQFFTAEVRLLETETQQEVLEIITPELCVVKVINNFQSNFSKMVDAWWKLTKYIGSQWHNLLVLEKSWNHGLCKKTTAAR